MSSPAMKYERIEPIDKPAQRSYSPTVIATQSVGHLSVLRCSNLSDVGRRLNASNSPGIPIPLFAELRQHVSDIARIHGTIEEDEVVPVVREFLRDSDPETRGKAQDALDDFSTFLGWNSRKRRKLLAA